MTKPIRWGLLLLVIAALGLIVFDSLIWDPLVVTPKGPLSPLATPTRVDDSIAPQSADPLRQVLSSDSRNLHFVRDDNSPVSGVLVNTLSRSGLFASQLSSDKGRVELDSGQEWMVFATLAGHCGFFDKVQAGLSRRYTMRRSGAVHIKMSGATAVVRTSLKATLVDPAVNGHDQDRSLTVPLYMKNGSRVHEARHQLSNIATCPEDGFADLSWLAGSSTAVRVKAAEILFALKDGPPRGDPNSLNVLLCRFSAYPNYEPLIKPFDKHGSVTWGSVPAGSTYRWRLTGKIRVTMDPPHDGKFEGVTRGSLARTTYRDSISGPFALDCNGITLHPIITMPSIIVGAASNSDTNLSLFHAGHDARFAAAGVLSTIFEDRRIVSESFKILSVLPGRKLLMADWCDSDGVTQVLTKKFSISPGETKDVGMLDGPDTSTNSVSISTGLVGASDGASLTATSVLKPDVEVRLIIARSDPRDRKTGETGHFGWNILPGSTKRLAGLRPGTWQAMMIVASSDAAREGYKLQGTVASKEFTVPTKDVVALQIPVISNDSLTGFRIIAKTRPEEEGAQYFIRVRKSGTTYSAIVGRNGALTTESEGGIVRLAPGKTIVTVLPAQEVATGRATPSYWGEAEVEVLRSGGISNIALAMHRGRTLRGTVRLRDGHAASGQYLRFRVLNMSTAFDFSVTLDKEGGFEIYGAPINRRIMSSKCMEVVAVPQFGDVQFTLK